MCWSCEACSEFLWNSFRKTSTRLALQLLQVLEAALKCYGLRNDGVLRWMRNDETQSTLQIKLSSLKNLRAEGSLRSLFLHIPSPIFLPQSFSPGRKGGGPRTLTLVPGVCVLVVQP